MGAEVGMIIPVTSKTWTRIYYPIRDHFLQGELVDMAEKGRYLEDCFASLGLHLFNDGSEDSRWTHVELADDVDLIELVLRWSD